MMDHHHLNCDSFKYADFKQLNIHILIIQLQAYVALRNFSIIFYIFIFIYQNENYLQNNI